MLKVVAGRGVNRNLTVTKSASICTLFVDFMKTIC